MKNGTLNTILIGAAIGVGAYIIYKSVEARRKEKSRFSGADGNEVIRYKTPTWTVG